MDAARFRSAAWVTTACLLVLGAADLAGGGPGTGSGVVVPAGGVRPAALPAGPRITIGLAPAAVGTVAAAREPACRPKWGGGPYPDEDVWVFGLPSAPAAPDAPDPRGAQDAPDAQDAPEAAKADAPEAQDAPGTARFIALTPVFTAGDQGRVAVAVPAEGGAIVDDRGAALAWLRLPAGWTLAGGTATIAGDADRFVLAGVCAAAGPPAAGPSAVRPPASP